MIQIAEVDGEAAAFMVVLPNINEAIRGLHGRLFPFGWAKLLWRLKVRYPGTFRVPLMGVRRRFQRSRLGTALAFLVIEAARPSVNRHGVKEIELSWILEDNAGMRSIIESIGGRAYKRYRVYERNPRCALKCASTPSCSPQIAAGTTPWPPPRGSRPSALLPCGGSDGGARHPRPARKRVRGHHSALRPDGRIAAGFAGTAPDGGRETRSLDGPAWHAVRQRRGRAGRPAGRPTRVPDDRRPPVAAPGHGAALSRPGERGRLRCRGRAGAPRTRAACLSAYATYGVEIQRRALLRLQYVRFSLAPRARHGSALEEGRGPAQAACPGDWPDWLGRDAPICDLAS